MFQKQFSQIAIVLVCTGCKWLPKKFVIVTIKLARYARNLTV